MAIVLDTFTESSDTLLSDHTPEEGGAWVQHPNWAFNITVSGGGNNFLNGSAGAELGIYYNVASPINANQEVFVEIKIVDNAIATYPGCCARVDTAVNTMYQLYFDQTDLKLHLRKVVTGTITALATSPGTHTINNGELHNFELLVSGSDITIKWDNVIDFTFSDGIITSVGKVSVIQYASSGQQVTTFQAFDITIPGDGSAPFGFTVDAKLI